MRIGFKQGDMGCQLVIHVMIARVNTEKFIKSIVVCII